MRIIEGKGPPSQDTFGNSNYIYKDVDTGMFYRCCGNINEDRTLPYGPAHKHPGEQYLWTPVDGNGGSGGGGGAKFEFARVTIHVDTNGYKSFGEVFSSISGIFVNEEGYVTDAHMDIDTDSDVTVCVAKGSTLIVWAEDDFGNSSIDDVKEGSATTIVKLPACYICDINNECTIKVSVVG